MASWDELEREIRVIALGVIRRYEPALTAAEVDERAGGVVERLRTRADEFERTVGLSQDHDSFRRLVELVAEFAAVEIGEGLSREIRRVARRVARGVTDVDDIVNDVVESLLVRDRRDLAYVMDVAASMNDFDGLVGMHVGRVRSREIKATVLDNLLDRCRKLLREQAFVEVGSVGGKPAFAARSMEGGVELRPATTQELAIATARIWDFPQVPLPRGDRASMVYSTETLRVLLAEVAASLRVAFTLDDVAEVLRPVLAAYLPVFLYDEGRLKEEVGAGLDPADAAVGAEAAEEILESLTGEVRTALALFLLETKKIDIAPLIDRTRPTVDRRLEEAQAILRKALSEASPSAEQYALEKIGEVLGAEGLAVLCGAILRERPFMGLEGADGEQLYATQEASSRARRTTAAEIDEIAMTLSSPDDAGPASLDWLREVLVTAVDALPAAITREDAAEIVSRVLTRPRREGV